jgi:hypothetical protein
MATTTNFGWETPDDTDLVKDGAAAMRTLGNSIDTSFVDLKGGTTNQVLAKNSNTDLDFKWVADATGIPATIFDAKGDIIAATAADTADRLAVGTNGQVLTADSSTATGLKWASAATTFSGCAVRKSAAQSIADSTFTLVTFNTEDYDTDAYHDNSTNTSRFTVPSGKAGYFLLTGNIEFAGNNTGTRIVNLKKNGSTIRDVWQLESPGASGASFGLSRVLNLAVGDYVEIDVFQNSGMALDIASGTAGTCVEFTYLGA